MNSLEGYTVISNVDEEDMGIVVDACKTIEYRLHTMAIEGYKKTDILVYRDGDSYYIIGNPVMFESSLYDEFGQRTGEYIDVRNVFFEYKDDPREYGMDSLFSIQFPLPRLVVLVPDLIIKIDKQNYE